MLQMENGNDLFIKIRKSAEKVLSQCCDVDAFPNFTQISLLTPKLQLKSKKVAVMNNGNWIKAHKAK